MDGDSSHNMERVLVNRNTGRLVHFMKPSEVYNHDLKLCTMTQHLEESSYIFLYILQPSLTPFICLQDQFIFAELKRTYLRAWRIGVISLLTASVRDFLIDIQSKYGGEKYFTLLGFDSGGNPPDYWSIYSRVLPYVTQQEYTSRIINIQEIPSLKEIKRQHCDIEKVKALIEARKWLQGGIRRRKKDADLLQTYDLLNPPKEQSSSSSGPSTATSLPLGPNFNLNHPGSSTSRKTSLPIGGGVDSMVPPRKCGESDDDRTWRLLEAELNELQHPNGYVFPSDSEEDEEKLDSEASERDESESGD